MAKINNIPTLTAYQQKFLAWQLDRRRSSSDEDKFTSVLAEAQVDLNPHQVDAALFAFKSPLSMGAVLADEVGLGKTIEAALVISQQWAERHRHILVIAPATLRKQWSMELEEKFFLPSVILESKNFNRILSDTYSNPFDDKEHIIICSYQFAKKQIHHIGRVNWNLVVLDEAHKLRNVYKSSNKTAIVLKEGLKNYKKLLLTATPLQNNVKELYGLISIIDDGYFGGLKSFNDRYGKTELRKESTYKDLRERIQPIIHRILRSDVQEYVKYTERKAMVQEYYPSDDEQILGEMVSEYLQRDECFGMPRSQRSLITLVLHKLLSSSTFAIAGTLQTIIDRLENIVKDNTSDEDSDAMLVNDLSNDIEEFEEYEDEIRVVGGWVPDLMFPQEGHVGSVDVDIMINHLTLQDEGYQNMSRILQKNGYKEHPKKYFSFVKTVMVDGISYDVDVDILAGMYGGTQSKRRSQHVQGIKALKATGGNFAFEFPAQKISVEAERPDGAIDVANVSVVAVVPYLIMKTAAMGRGKAKDAYDIYFIIKHYIGGVRELAKEFEPVRDKNIVIEVKDKLAGKFASENHAGPKDVADFMDLEDEESIEMIKRDAYEQVQALLNLI